MDGKSTELKTCQYCGEEIKAKAIKCKYCHSDLSQNDLSEVTTKLDKTLTNINDYGLSEIEDVDLQDSTDSSRTTDNVEDDRVLTEQTTQFQNNQNLNQHSDQALDKSLTENSLGNEEMYKKCPFCAEKILAEAIKCKFCGSMIGNVGGELKTTPLNSYNNQDRSIAQSKVLFVIEGLKKTNTPILWISLDYWNLYITNHSVIAVRLHRGWWGLIGFIVGLPLYFVTFLFTSGLGIIFDKNRGEAKCRLMSDRFGDILANIEKYMIVEVIYNQVGGLGSSDLCLGNMWLRYSISLGKDKFYFEESKFQVVKEAYDLIRGV